MEIFILTCFLIFYILYNELHKLKIKNQKKEFQIPRTFYENLKDTIQYIDYTLESIKQKQENINKIYLKMLELKREFEEIQKTRTKKVPKKTIKNKDIPNPATNNELNQDAPKVENTYIEKLLQDSETDKIEFSFQREKKENSLNYVFKPVNSTQSHILEKIGKFFRKTFQLPEIPITISKNEEKESKEKINLELKNKPISLEDYEKQLLKENSNKKESYQNGETTKSDTILQKEIDSNLDSTVQTHNSKKSVNQEIDREEARKIVILETKKIYSEITNKDKQWQFIKKLIEIGFTKDEIHQITKIPISEIMLIEKIQKRKGNELNGS